MSASYIRPRIILFAFLFFYIVTIDFMFIMQIKLSNQIKTYNSSRSRDQSFEYITEA